jgi:hypothetical protein
VTIITTATTTGITVIGVAITGATGIGTTATGVGAITIVPGVIARQRVNENPLSGKRRGDFCMRL